MQVMNPMKKINSTYPRRGAMLSAPFLSLSDDEFLELVSHRLAIPAQQGNSLIVSKWRDGPGMDPGEFLRAMKDQGRSLEVRRFNGDVNVRLVRQKPRRGVRPRAPDRPVQT
jgi:hypothetical protein